MRTLSFALALLLLAHPAIADGPAFKTVKVEMAIDLGTGHTLTYTRRPLLAKTTPEYVEFTISAGATPIVRTQGDPIIHLGGKRVGTWPYKHVTYLLKGGVRVTGHADAPDGNTHSLEVYRPDGTMLKITGLDTAKPKVVVYGTLARWAYEKVSPKTFTLDLRDIE